jgi:ABC-type multidrug transport system ATPase subunit
MQVNGAGKTTTFRMLTGDESPTEGQIIAAGHDLATHLREARQYIGYCPQYDALIDLLTAREHLVMYARLRGVPEEQVGGLVAELIQRMDLSLYADKPSYTYSGGNKRKLSTAIALIGDPEVRVATRCAPCAFGERLSPARLLGMLRLCTWMSRARAWIPPRGVSCGRCWSK